MPKVVDHGRRRAELGAAVRRVVAREGVEGATVRRVAAEAGWSMGALRYYFTTQQELLDFAVDASLADIPARVLDILEHRRPGMRRAQTLLEQLLPLDADRLAEVRVYLAFMARNLAEGGRPGLADQAWHGERYICGWAVSDVTGLAPPNTLGHVPPPLRAAVDELQVFVDGLSFLGATMTNRLTPAASRRLLRAHLARLANPPHRGD